MTKEGPYQQIKNFFASGEGYEWWAELHRSNQEKGVSRRGDRAELKRCRTIDEIYLVPGFHRLRYQVRDANLPISDERLALVAGVLAEVREKAGDESFGKRMAKRADGSDRAQVSGLRFRRLIQLEEPNDLYARLRRTIRLCDRRTSIGRLAADVAYWGPKTKRNWANDYYQSAPEED